MLVNTNEVIQEILKEAEKLDPLEQQILLTKLRVKRLSKKGTGVIANPPKGLKAPTMKQIDKWKHESRKKA
jgi:predicted RNA methylase